MILIALSHRVPTTHTSRHALAYKSPCPGCQCSRSRQHAPARFGVAWATVPSCPWLHPVTQPYFAGSIFGSGLNVGRGSAFFAAGTTGLGAGFSVGVTVVFAGVGEF